MNCFLIVCFVVGWVSAQTSICSETLYREDCIAAHPECGFCCSAAVGDQCFNTSEINPPCAGNHIVTNSSCESLCGILASDCDTCAQLVWCYFCDSSDKCQGPKQHCSGGAVMQTCNPSTPSNIGSSNGSDDKWFHIVMYTSLFAAGILIILGAVVAGLRCRRGWVQQQRFRAEARPLLSPSNRIGAPATPATVVTQQELSSQVTSARTVDDSEAVPTATMNAEPVPYAPATVNNDQSSDSSSTSDSLCQLCFDNAAVVAFLPCYHVHCCTECANRIRPGRVFNRYITCPFCRQKIRTMVRLTSLVQKKVL
ncbi:zinc finger protein, putative [Bodo saltans]|uniref:Zinc finger protein, putative n=1 Tax=Bodo saltans TaxID=75058 RepID=A0A0S4IN45_BODSA|nr:zinc finger protein, putative [Bodo saltans]|eukprot:CUE78965.1 zinc finger protein, putative [Bodo saltans]